MQILAVRPLADHAVTLDLAPEPGAIAAALTGAATGAIKAAMAAGDLPGAEEVAGAFCSVTIHYDSFAIAQADLIGRLRAILDPVQPGGATLGRLWHLPCCYADGIDLPDLSAHLGLPESRIISLHAGVTFRVHALGFLPGLPFMGELPRELARPRRESPRAAVPAGSVAIANRMCVIYPWVSPGGWHIVGHCPVPLFDSTRPVPALLSVGDRVRFRPVGTDEAEALRHTPPDPATLVEEGGDAVA